MEKETLQSALAEFPQVPTVNIKNVKTFLAVMANGSIQQMSKENMASVLGELMSSQKLFPFMYRGTVSDFNSATEPGYYNVAAESDIPNQPDGAYRYGTLLVYGVDFITQEFVSDSYNIKYVRDFYKVWRPWKKYSPTT